MASRWLKTLTLAILPVFFLLLSVHILVWTAGIWVPWEYKLPGFPQDRYGFSFDDRVRWSAVDIQYLQSNEGIDYFDKYVLDTGEPMHNERELRHMQDVKDLLDASEWVLIGIAFALVGSFVYVGVRQGRAELAALLSGAGRITLFLMLILGLVLAISFRFLFVGFHRIFFEGDTWLFAYSDTFIRLYPQRFWLDVFIYIAGLTMLQAVLTWFGARWLLRRPVKQA